MWTVINWLKIGPSSEHGNEPSGSIKEREFIDQLNNLLLLKVSASRSVSLVSWVVGWLVGWLFS
jgi:hypothetical protein